MKKTKRFSSPFVRGILGIRKITFHKNDNEGPQWGSTPTIDICQIYRLFEIVSTSVLSISLQTGGNLAKAEYQIRRKKTPVHP